MKRCKIFVVVIALFFSFVFNLIPISPIYAVNNEIDVKFTPSVNEIQESEVFTYDMSISSKNLQDIATYRVTISYDNSKFLYKSISFSDDVNKSDFKYNVEDGKIIIIFLSENSLIYLNEGQTTNILSVKFKVQSGASLGESSINAVIDGMADDNIKAIDINSVSVEPINIIGERHSDCTLKSLSISDGILVPEFSSNVNNYTADVQSSVKTVEVYAQPNDNTASVTVSRKTLGKIGSSTDIKVTVTSADKKDKMIYYITVNRLEDTESNKSTTSSKKTSTSSTSSKDKSSSTSSGKSSIDNIDDESQQESLQRSVDNSSQVILKADRFLPFIVGTLTILCPLLGYAIYKYRIKKK